MLEGRRAWELGWFCVEKVWLERKMKMEMILIRAGKLRCWGDVLVIPVVNRRPRLSVV